MKRVLIPLVGLLLLLGQSIESQETKKVQEPEFLGTYFLLEPGTGNLIRLERQSAVGKFELRGMGFGGGSSSIEIRGERSPVRFREGQKLEFVVLVASQQVDPHGMVEFFFLEPDDGKRKILAGKVGSMGSSSESTIGAAAVAFDASKYGASSFKVTPTDLLPPGEYGLGVRESKEAFLFGIDAVPGSRASRLERIVPFRTGEPIPLGIVELAATIDSVTVTGWPKPEVVRAAEAAPNGTTSLALSFTYSNRGLKTWKCRYHVDILDESGTEIGTGERNARLGKGQSDDTNGVSVKMRTLDFPKAAKLRVRVQVQRD